MSAKAAFQIADPLLRRVRRGRGAVIVVLFEDRIPQDLHQQVEELFRQAGLKLERLDFNELAPNPVERLVELRRQNSIDSFSVIVDAKRMVTDGWVLVDALNMHRTIFAEENLSAIFWIPKRVMPDFSRHASNFLDFRNRLIEIDADGGILSGIPVLEASTPDKRLVTVRALISYPYRYHDWVETLRRNLEQSLAHAGASAEILLDRGDRTGWSWIARLEQGFERAEHLLLVVTPEIMVTPRERDEWESFLNRRRDWQGHLHWLHLVDTPLPMALSVIQGIDFRHYDDAGYRQGLRQISAELLGCGPRESLELPPDMEAPTPPRFKLPDGLRRRLVDWLIPEIRSRFNRRAVAAALGLKRYALDGYTSLEGAASAAVVLATGDDDPVAAATRITNILINELDDVEPSRTTELEVVRAELENLSPTSALLRIWLDCVKHDHGTLVPYFQDADGFNHLARSYVQLELRPDIHVDIHHKLLGIREVLDLDPTQQRWVTRRWVVRGDPGSGKTTLLRHLAATLAAEVDSTLIPIFESLPRLLRESEWLLTRIERRLLQIGQRSRGIAAALDRLGQEGRLLLLLDGFDEVPRELRGDAEVLLHDLAARWPRATIVVSTRPIGFRRLGSDFQELELQPLDDQRRQEFLARWFGRFSDTPDEDRAAHAASVLESDQGLRELASNPLYLTLLALLIEQGSEPQRNLTSLYDQIFDVLLNGRHRPHEASIMPRRKSVLDLLRYVAYEMTVDNSDAEPVEELERRLYQPAMDTLRDRLEREPRWRRSLRPLLDDIAERTGILGPHDGPDADWRFWHRTFREALAAEYLATIVREGGQDALLEHVREIRNDEGRWAEPYALLVGHMEDPDDLVQTLVETNRALGLRALATAQGLRDETLRKILGLADDRWDRAHIYAQLPDLIDEPDRALALLDRLRRATRDGYDLFYLDLSIQKIGRRWPDWARRAEQMRGWLHGHIPAPPEDLFRQIELPLDGLISLWPEIPAGRFRMGSREVTIPSPFRIAVVPVTNAQYATFDPSHEPATWEGLSEEELPHHPVSGITHQEAVSFCRWLSTMVPSARGARLPTQEEWEYACRADTESRFWSGDTEADLVRVGWYVGNSGGRTHRVGEKPANPWGLYDVHGNVWEWTSSHRYALDTVTQTPIFRGGSYREDARDLSAACRGSVGGPFPMLGDIGFRIVLPGLP